MKKVLIASLAILTGVAHADCDGERKVLARSDIQGETRLVWEKQLAICLGNIERVKEINARLDAEMKARAEEEAEKSRRLESRWNSFKEPIHGSKTYYRDNYAREIGRNQIIEEEFGDQCPVKSSLDKARGLKYDEICLDSWSKVNNLRYRNKFSLELDKKFAEEEPSQVRAAEAVEIALNKAKAEAARRAKLPGVSIGMTADQVINNSSWGRPREVNRTTTASGTREQWVYNSRSYLYFTNGVLTAIQN